MQKLAKAILYFLLSITVLVILMKVFFPFYRIATDSMEPTYKRGDIVVVSRFHYDFFQPKREEIILIKPIEGVFNRGVWVHRIIALPDDQVAIRNKIVKVNGKEPLFPRTFNTDMGLTVAPDNVFQKGDNPHSLTCLVPQNEIIGKVIYGFSI